MIESILFTNFLSVITEDKNKSLRNLIFKATIPYLDSKYTIIYNLSKNKILKLTLASGEEFILDRPVLVTTEEIKSVKYKIPAIQTQGNIVALNSTNKSKFNIEDRDVEFTEIDQEKINSYFLDHTKYMLNILEAEESNFLFKIPLSEEILNYCRNSGNSVRLVISQYSVPTINESKIINSFLYTNNFISAFNIIKQTKYFSLTESKNKTTEIKNRIRVNSNSIDSRVLSLVGNYELLTVIDDMLKKILNFQTLLKEESDES